MDLKEIQNLIKFVAKSGANEVKLEMDDVKITIRTGSEGQKGETTFVQQLPMQSAPAQQPAPQQQQQPASSQQSGSSEAPAEKKSEENDESKYTTIKSPIIGTFYRKPAPDKPTFVDVGSKVKIGDVLCVIEAMKLFNEIESEVKGTIVKVLVDDASPVEFDQPLFLVDPS